MFCSKCGRRIDDSANFCPYCREETGMGNMKKLQELNTKNDTKPSKKEKRNPKKGKKPWKALIIAVVLVIVIGGITFWKRTNNRNNIGFENVSMSREEILSATTQYDNGDWLYQPKKKNIAFDEEEKRIYYNNLLTVFLKSKLSSKDEERLANLVHGAIVGYIDGNISILQIMVDETNFSTLQHYSDILMETEPVFYAAASIPIMTSEEKTKKEDLLWNGDKDIGNEESPNGVDWWAEAIGAYTAWKYSDLVQPVTVGIIDNRFELNHKDLCDESGNSIITMLNKNSVDKKAKSPEHGTHVTGIIAAQNNTFGIRGIADRATILAADKYPIKGQEETEEESAEEESNSSPEFVYEHMKRMILMAKSENSAIVINNSWSIDARKIKDVLEELGYKIKNQDQRTAHQNWEIDSAKYAIEVVECLRLNYGDRFIIVQSAGNGIDELGVGYNARKNGWFSGITEATYKEKMQELRKNDPKMAEAFLSYEDIKAHIMIVGAVENALDNNMYKMTGFSNYGYSVDICAPGKHIYSTVLNNKYGYLDGTSMAAPIVSGSAAYLWSLRPDLSASEVKDSLIKYADKAVGVTAKDKGNIYPMVNIGRAVKNMAVGTISGTVTDSETGEALSDVTCIVASEFNGEKGSISMQNNGDGTFAVTTLGKCKVILQKEGYVSVQMETEVGINDTISTGNISMKKKEVKDENQPEGILELYKKAMNLMDGQNFTFDVDDDIAISATEGSRSQSVSMYCDMSVNVENNNTDNMYTSGQCRVDVPGSSEIAYSFYCADGRGYYAYTKPRVQKAVVEYNSLEELMQYQYDIAKSDVRNAYKNTDSTYTLEVDADILNLKALLESVLGNSYNCQCDTVRIVFGLNDDGTPNQVITNFVINIEESGATGEIIFNLKYVFSHYGESNVEKPDDLESYLNSNQGVDNSEKIEIPQETYQDETEKNTWQIDNSEIDIPEDAFSYNGHQYYIYSDVCDSWDEARKYCESKGGYLAVISDMQENQALYEYMSDSGYRNAYFGYTDEEEEGNWKWIGKEKSTFSNWHEGEPNAENENEDYAMFYYKYTDGNWNDGDFGSWTVGSEKNFICEWNKDE